MKRDAGGTLFCATMQAVEVESVAKEWARWFYDSAIWRRQRDSYRRHVHNICELCGAPGEIVHHKHELTPQNIHDPKIALAFDNLQLLCRDCHALVHGKKDAGVGLRFDSRGELIRG